MYPSSGKLPELPKVKNHMSVLGLSSFDHDTAAALFQAGRVTAAVENDKVARTKTQGLPQAAIRFCVGEGETAWKEIDLIAVASSAFRGWLRESWCDTRLALNTPIASAYHQFNAIGQLKRHWDYLRTLRRLSGGNSRVVTFDHHLCHAANSFYSSPFERALIVTMDENGDGCSGMLAIGEKTGIRVLRRIPFPHSLAWLYSQVTEIAGFVPHKEEYKTQWFGMGGEPEFKPILQGVLGNSRSGVPRLDFRFARRGLDRRLTLSGRRLSGLARLLRRLRGGRRRGRRLPCWPGRVCGAWLLCCRSGPDGLSIGRRCAALGRRLGLVSKPLSFGMSVTCTGGDGNAGGDRGRACL